MSLIVATSRIDENTLPGSETPSNFKNFFRSPIEIEADSEIAVQSVKVQRTGNITIEEDDFFCHYFGTLPETINDYDSLTCFSRTIKPTRGTYSLSGYTKHIKDTLNGQYDDPRTFGGYLVDMHTSASGEELGLEISAVDKGEADTDIKTLISSTPTYNLKNPTDWWDNDIVKPSSGFSYTPGTGVFSRTTASGTKLNNTEAVGILKGAPFGLNDGEFKVETKTAATAPFAVGLTRPQIQIESYDNSISSDEIRGPGIRDLDTQTAPRENNDTTILDYQGRDTINGTYEMYDYVFMLDEDDEITIAERVWDTDVEVSRMQEMEYWENGFTGSTGAKLTKAEFNASWDGIQFKGKGDEIELYFKQNGKDVFDKVVASTFSNAAGRSFNPIGSTSYALYPQFNIQAGYMTVTKYESSNTVNTYSYPTFTTGANGFYRSGDDAFSNEAFYGLSAETYVSLKPALCSNSIQQLVEQCDSSDQKLKHEDVVGAYVYAGLNSASGVDFVHLFTMNKFISGADNDTLLKSQEFPNMSGRLGFVDRAFIISNSTDGYVSGDDTLTIKFISTGSLEKTSISSFIRIPNLTHKSFNGAQSGLSKILYQLPQFSNDGRQFGALHFEASEKTYVKLHNPSQMLLNQLQIQIVDSQERELNSLTGDTQIVFHIRRSK